MAQSTTVYNGCNVNLQIDNDAGTLVDASGSTNKVDMELDSDIGEYKTFASIFKGRLTCGADGKLTVDAVMSTAAGEALDILKKWWFTTRNSRTVQLNQPTNTTGSDRIQFEAVLESLKWTADVTNPDAMMVTAVILPNGAIVLSTVP